MKDEMVMNACISDNGVKDLHVFPRKDETHEVRVEQAVCTRQDKPTVDK